MAANCQLYWLPPRMSSCRPGFIDTPPSTTFRSRHASPLPRRHIIAARGRLGVTDEQSSRVASMFRTEAANVRRMSLSNISPKSRRLIAAKPMQFVRIARANRIRMDQSLYDEVNFSDGVSLPPLWFAAYR